MKTEYIRFGWVRFDWTQIRSDQKTGENKESHYDARESLALGKSKVSIVQATRAALAIATGGASVFSLIWVCVPSSSESPDKGTFIAIESSFPLYDMLGGRLDCFSGWSMV